MKLFLASIIAAFRQKPAAPLAAFRERFTGRTIIVHEGLSIGWVAELMKEAGGGAHFRFDTRKAPDARPTPIEWFVHRHVLPQGLPLPLLLRVEDGCVRARHLVRNGRVVHPSEIYWMLREMPQRIHLELKFAHDDVVACAKMPVDDNAVAFDLGEPQ